MRFRLVTKAITYLELTLLPAYLFGLATVCRSHSGVTFLGRRYLFHHFFWDEHTQILVANVGLIFFIGFVFSAFILLTSRPGMSLENCRNAVRLRFAFTLFHYIYFELYFALWNYDVAEWMSRFMHGIPIAVVSWYYEEISRAYDRNDVYFF